MGDGLAVVMEGVGGLGGDAGGGFVKMRKVVTEVGIGC